MSIRDHPRGLTIRWEKIQTPGQLVMVFQRPKSDQSESDSLKNTIPWKHVRFMYSGEAEKIRYTNNFGVGVVHIGADNVVTPGTWTQVSPGQNVILNKASDTDNLEFSPPSTVPDQGNLVTVDNLTHTRVDLSFGLHDTKTKTYTPTFIFPKTGDGATIVADFHPILHVFVNDDVKEGALVPTYIQVHRAIATIDLANLPYESEWMLREDENGAYTMKHQ